MTIRLRIAAAAERELAEADDWYRERNPRLGPAFRVAFDEVVDRIARNPRAYPEVRVGARRAMLHGFPYHVFFTVKGEDVVIAAVLHHARDPRRWPGR